MVTYNTEDITKLIDMFDNINYDCDGIVFRTTDDIMAFKILKLLYSTVEKILWDRSAKGRVTPVIQINTININGKEIRKISAHNLGILCNEMIMPGDTVEFEFKGDAIPILVKNITKSDISIDQYIEYIIQDIQSIYPSEVIKYDNIYVYVSVPEIIYILSGYKIPNYSLSRINSIVHGLELESLKCHSFLYKLFNDNIDMKHVKNISKEKIVEFLQSIRDKIIKDINYEICSYVTCIEGLTPNTVNRYIEDVKCIYDEDRNIIDYSHNLKSGDSQLKDNFINKLNEYLSYINYIMNIQLIFTNSRYFSKLKYRLIK